MSTLRRLSLEGSRVSEQGASYLSHNSSKLAVDLVFPFIWGQSWSFYNLSTPSKAADLAIPSLQQLKDLQSLRFLRVSEDLLTPEALRSLKDLPTLEDLSFKNTSITDDMLAELLGLSQVARLDFSDTRITDLGMTHLKDMQALRELNLQGTQVTGAGFVHLTNLTRLQALDLRGTPLDDKGVAHLAGLKELRKLELTNTRLTDAGIAYLVQLPRLQYLDLYGTKVKDAGVALLSQLKSLRYCYLTKTRITDAAIEHLRGLTELEELGLDGTPMTDHSLARLAPLTNLKRLRISRTQVTEAGCPIWRSCSNARTAGTGQSSRDERRPSGPSRNGETEVAGSFQYRDRRRRAGHPRRVSRTGRSECPRHRRNGRRCHQFPAAHPRINVITGKTPTGYSDWAKAIAIFYVIAVCAICFYGFHRLWLACRLLWDRQVRKRARKPGRGNSPTCPG